MKIQTLSLYHARYFASKSTPPIGYFSASLSRTRNKRYAASANAGDSILKVNAKLVTPKHLSKALLKIARMDLEKQRVEYILESCIKQMPQAIDQVNVSLATSIILKLGLNSPTLLNQLLPFCYKVQDFDRSVAIAHMLAMILANNTSILQQDKGVKTYVTSVAQAVPLNPQYVNFKTLGRLCESLTTLNLYSLEFAKVLEWLMQGEVGAPGVVIETCNLASIALYLGKMGLGTIEDWNHWQNAAMSTSSAHASNTRDIIKILQAYMYRQVYSKELLGNLGDVLSSRAHELVPNQVCTLANVYCTFDFWHQTLFKNIIDAMEHLLMPRYKYNAIDVMQTCLWCHTNGLEIPKRTLAVLAKTIATKRLYLDNYNVQLLSATSNALGIQMPIAIELNKLQ